MQPLTEGWRFVMSLSGTLLCRGGERCQCTAVLYECGPRVATTCRNKCSRSWCVRLRRGGQGRRLIGSYSKLCPPREPHQSGGVDPASSFQARRELGFTARPTTTHVYTEALRQPRQLLSVGRRPPKIMCTLSRKHISACSARLAGCTQVV